MPTSSKYRVLNGIPIALYEFKTQKRSITALFLFGESVLKKLPITVLMIFTIFFSLKAFSSGEDSGFDVSGGGGGVVVSGEYNIENLWGDLHWSIAEVTTQLIQALSIYHHKGGFPLPLSPDQKHAMQLAFSKNNKKSMLSLMHKFFWQKRDKYTRKLNVVVLREKEGRCVNATDESEESKVGTHMSCPCWDNHGNEKRATFFFREGKYSEEKRDESRMCFSASGILDLVNKYERSTAIRKVSGVILHELFHSAARENKWLLKAGLEERLGHSLEELAMEFIMIADESIKFKMSESYLRFWSEIRSVYLLFDISDVYFSQDGAFLSEAAKKQFTREMSVMSSVFSKRVLGKNYLKVGRTGKNNHLLSFLNLEQFLKFEKVRKMLASADMFLNVDATLNIPSELLTYRKRQPNGSFIYNIEGPVPKGGIKAELKKLKELLRELIVSRPDRIATSYD